MPQAPAGQPAQPPVPASIARALAQFDIACLGWHRTIAANAVSIEELRRCWREMTDAQDVLYAEIRRWGDRHRVSVSREAHS